MKSVLIVGEPKLSLAFTKKLKSAGVRSYSICDTPYLDPNTIKIRKSLFQL